MIALLGLVPLPGEGGYFRETYRSQVVISDHELPARYVVRAPKSLATAIYYFLTPDTYSALHRLSADEVYHFYLGDPVDLTTIDDAGEASLVRLGQDLAAGMECQHVVKAGVWQGSRLVAGGDWALLGTTVAPGFEFADLELADRSILERFPQHSAIMQPLLPRR